MYSPSCLSDASSLCAIQSHTTPLGQHALSCQTNKAAPGHPHSVGRPYDCDTTSYVTQHIYQEQTTLQIPQLLLSLQPQVGTAQPYSAFYLTAMGLTIMGSPCDGHKNPTLLDQWCHQMVIIGGCSPSAHGHKNYVMLSLSSYFSHKYSAR